MKRSQFSYKQALGDIEGGRDGADGGGSLARGRVRGVDNVQTEVEVWRDDGGGDQAFERAGGREREAQADVRGRVVGGQGVEGSDQKKGWS